MPLLTDLRNFAVQAPAHPVMATRELIKKRWMRFALMGFLATATYYLLGLVFVTWLRFPLLFGNTLAYLPSFMVSFLGQARWTFKTENSLVKSLPRYALTQTGGLLLNSFIIGTLGRYGIPYPLAMLAAICLVPVFVYLLCAFWVFRTNPKKP